MIVFLLFPQLVVNTDGAIYFILAGLVAPGLASRFRDIGLNRLGVTLTSPIVGTTTFISMIMAVFFLDEEITISLLLGAVLIFVGVNFLTTHGNRVEWQKKDLIYPVGAALLFAISTTLRKIGLSMISSPIVGAAITSTVSLIVLIGFIFISRVRRTNTWVIEINKNAVKYFGFSGFISSVAFLFYFLALNSSFVVKIQPIAGSNPLFALLFSYIFLRDVEHINSRIILATILIVIGIVLITI
jgi:uncharacterized membrane protein